MNIEQANEHSSTPLPPAEYPSTPHTHSPRPPSCPVTSRTLFCHSSVNSGELVFTWLALSVHSGHFQAGRDSMAREGARKANVPPWRMGSLEEGKNTVSHTVLQHWSVTTLNWGPFNPQAQLGLEAAQGACCSQYTRSSCEASAQTLEPCRPSDG